VEGPNAEPMPETSPNGEAVCQCTLTQLYEHSREQLRAVAARYVGDEAEDVVQDAFVSALRSATTFRGEAAPLTWLHRIVVNTSINHCRRRTCRDSIRLPQHSAMVDARTEEALDLRRAIRNLAPDHSRVFMMYELIGLTHNEIATLLAIPVGTSKWRLSKARTSLHNALTLEAWTRRAVRRTRHSARDNGRLT
jgi:RNA polymerase sigma-70 factor (ECF subfamily)